MSCPHCVKGKTKADRRIMGVMIEVEVTCEACGGNYNPDPVPCSDGSVDFSSVDWSKVYVDNGECCFREDAVEREIAALKYYYNSGGWDCAAGYYDWRKGAKAES